MGFMDEFKKKTRPYDDDDEEAEGYDDPMDSDDPFAPRGSYDNSPVRPTAGRVVSMPQVSKTQVVVFRPTTYEKAVTEIADKFREKRVVVLNMEETDKDVERRLVDFLSGCAYVLDGKMQKTSQKTHIMVPHGVELTGDLIERAEARSAYSDNPQL